jgi:hypothetical protein
MMKVNLAIYAFGLSKEEVATSNGADISLNGSGHTTSCDNGIHDRLGVRCRIDIVDDHFSTVATQMSGDTRADATAGACDDGNLVISYA